MNCPNCKTQVAEGKKFCGACGTPLAGSAPVTPGVATQACISCGAPLREGKKFCGVCGKPQTTQAAIPQASSQVCAGNGEAVTPVPFSSSPGPKPAMAQRPVLPPRAQQRPRKPVNWRKLTLWAGPPLLLIVGGLCAWFFLPRIPLPPEKKGNVLDVSAAARFVYFSPAVSGRKPVRLFSGGTIWDIPSGKVVAQGLNSYSILSPDGEHVMNGNAILSVLTSKSVPLESPALPGSLVPGTTFSLSRFSNSGRFIVQDRNGWLYLLDAETGKVLHLLNNQASSQLCGILSASFSPDDKMLAAGDVGGNITLWNVKEGELQATLSGDSSIPCDEASRTPLGSWRQVWSVAYSPNGRMLASADNDGVVHIWDLESRKLLRTIPLQITRAGVRFTPDGRFLVTSSILPMSSDSAGNPQQRTSALLFVDPLQGNLIQSLAVPGFAGTGFVSNGDVFIATILNDRLKVDQWTLGREIKIPFTAPRVQTLASSPPVLLAAYEEHTVYHLQQLQTQLSKYKSSGEHNGFPSTLVDLTTEEAPFREEIHGYRYKYTPAPDPQGIISGYTILATPLAFRQTGSNSYLIDQTGELRATTENRAALIGDPVVRTLHDATQSATNTQAGATGSVAQPSVATAATQPAAPQSGATPAHPAQNTATANQWISQAEVQFQQGNYREALQTCDAALRLDPGNARASQLKAKVEETMRILGKN